MPAFDIDSYVGRSRAVDLAAIDWAAVPRRGPWRSVFWYLTTGYFARVMKRIRAKFEWCPINCTRTFIDVRLPGATGRPWSKLPLAAGWERVTSGNSCPKGLVEDVNELREVKAKLEEVKRDYPNVARW